MTALLDVRDLGVTFRLRREGDMPWTPPRQLRALNGGVLYAEGRRNPWNCGRIRLWQVHPCPRPYSDGAGHRAGGVGWHDGFAVA